MSKAAMMDDIALSMNLIAFFCAKFLSPTKGNVKWNETELCLCCLNYWVRYQWIYSQDL